MLPKEKTLIEIQYPTFKWKITNKKLYVMNLVNTSSCNKCISGNEQTPLHMFLQCQYINSLFQWVLNCLFHICRFRPSSNIRFIYFDNVYSSLYQKNICNIFLYIYIITIWRTRKENLRIGNLKFIMLRRLEEYKQFIKHVPNTRCEKLSSDLSNVDIDFLMKL